MLNALRKVFAPRRPKAGLEVRFRKQGAGWLADHLAEILAPPPPANAGLIEARARDADRLGPRPLWSGYRSVGQYPADTTGSRRANQVRSDAAMGAFYSWLVRTRRARTVVEFGTAFGVSGMYWLAGLAEVDDGMLFTFEPNADWAAIARTNLAAVSDRFHLTVGTFEENAEAALAGQSVDIALIDAIHTSAFVKEQYAILRRFMRPGGLVLLDDIHFSDDMRQCWTDISSRPEIAASASVGERLGVVELGARG